MELADLAVFVEAAQAMGATTGQIVWKVLLPEALPGIVAGLTSHSTWLLIIDADTPIARASLATWWGTLGVGPLPAPTVETPGGGLHWLCQVDLAPVGRFHSAPPEWGPEPLESGVWMGGRGCAVWLRRLVGIASRCVRMPSS